MQPSGDQQAPSQAPPSDSEIAELFKIADADGNGSLSKEEARNFINAANGTVSDEALDYLYQTLDTNEDGEVSLDEILSSIHAPPPCPADQYTQVFNSIDQDQDGHLSFEELSNWLSESAGIHLEADQLQAAFGYVDTNHDDSIDLAEFLALLGIQAPEQHE